MNRIVPHDTCQLAPNKCPGGGGVWVGPARWGRGAVMLCPHGPGARLHVTGAVSAHVHDAGEATGKGAADSRRHRTSQKPAHEMVWRVPGFTDGHRPNSGEQGQGDLPCGPAEGQGHVRGQNVVFPSGVTDQQFRNAPQGGAPGHGAPGLTPSHRRARPGHMLLVRTSPKHKCLFLSSVCPVAMERV